MPDHVDGMRELIRKHPDDVARLRRVTCFDSF